MNNPMIARVPKVKGRHQYWMNRSGMIGTTSGWGFRSVVLA